MNTGEVLLGSSNEVEEGEGRRFEVAGRQPIAVFRVEGQLLAIDDPCTHGAASLSEGWLEGDEVECPVHQGRFCLRTGRALCFPVTEPVAVHSVVERDGQLFLDAPASFQKVS